MKPVETPNAAAGQSANGEPAGKPVARNLMRSSLHLEIVTVLRDMIQIGELAPCSVISERKLCEQFGISRTPLREALKVLASEGLIRLRPHRAPLVSGVDRGEVAELFEMLSIIEPGAAEIACRRVSQEEIAHLSRMHSDLMALYATQQRTLYFSLNLAVHHEIMRLAGNKSLLAIYEQIQARVRRARSIANLDPERWHESNAEHCLLIQAFQRRDPDAVKALLLSHTVRTGNAVLRELDTLAGDKP